jgi:murein DD-endopeptidase MepM/ murein hydrolase activator NlpD
MARLQIADNTRVAPAQSVGPIASAPQANGGEIAGRQLQQLGQQVERTGQVAADFQIKAMDAANTARVNEALTAAQRLALEKQSEVSQLRGANAMPGEDGRPITEVYSSDFDQALPTIARDLNLTATQTEMFRERSQPLGMTFRQGVQRHEQEQVEVYKEDVYKSGVATRQQAALVAWNSPEALGLALEDIRTITTDRAYDRGMSPEATALAIRENVGLAVLNVVNANADTAPRAMRDFLEANGSRMTPAQLEAAQDKVNPAMAVLDGRDWVASRLAGAAPVAGEPGATVQPPVEGSVVISDPVEGARPGSGYGPRVSFATSGGQRASSNHDGVDFPARMGAPVRSVASGTVVSVQDNGDRGYGKIVEIRHADGVTTAYAHLQGFNVREGDTVAAGQTIGAVGSTGSSTGPHLHLRARRNGVSFDPMELLGAGTISGPSATAEAGPSGPTKAQLIREARAEFGENPQQLAAVIAEINTEFSLRDAAETETKQNVLEDAYRTIDAGGNLSASQRQAVMAASPGSIQTLDNYRQARDQPAPVRSDPAVLLEIAANPSIIENMTPEEIVARYQGKVSLSDLTSMVGASAREAVSGARTLQTRAQEAQIVPQTVFSGAWARALDTRGIDRTPEGKSADAERQGLTMVMEQIRDNVVRRQVAQGSQLTPAQMDEEVARGLAPLAWERRGMFGGYEDGYSTSFATMTPARRDQFKESEKARLGRDATEAEVYAAYLRNRIGGR